MIPGGELQLECPDLVKKSETELQVNDTCRFVESYDKLITCSNEDDDYHGYDGMCEMSFPTSCSAFLGKKEVRFECISKESLDGQTLLLLIPPNTSILYLVDNGIIQIDANAFQHLTNLRELHLYYNPLVELPSMVFKSMVHLTYLFLRDNSIHTLHSGVFDGLVNLKYLDLSGNQLGSDESDVLDPTLFQKLEKLQILYLHNNGLRRVPDGLFAGLRNLIQLTISLNNFVSLQENIFRDLENLEYVNLRGNVLTELPGGLFHGLVQLVYLALYNNHLESLSTEQFYGLSQLITLVLYNNNLKSLPISIFKGLSQLQYLILSNNILKSPDNTTLQDSVNLRNIDFGNNQLTDVTGLFKGLRNLEFLSLYNNSILSLDSGVFQDLTSLLEVNINYNLITVLPTDLFYELHGLKKLICAGNRLSTIDANIFKNARIRLPNLLIVFLNKNKFSILPSRLFRDVSTLENIVLDENKLKRLAYDMFHDLGNLTFLTLHSNELNDLDDRLFKDTTELRYLTLHNNKLKNLRKGIFNGLIKLERLTLSNNRLSNLDPAIFVDAVNITYMEMYNNRLTKIPNVNELTQLTFLNIRFNALTDIDDVTFAGLAKNTELLVSQHEICECYVPIDTICSASDNMSPYLTCDRLLSDRVLVALMWIIGINALCGNIFVIIWRRKSPQKNRVQDTLLTNLAMSDLLMGVYMIIIASADIYFSEHFPMQSETWRSGITCRLAGAISIISSEASVFFVTLISIDRFICIRFPFTVHKLGKRSVTMTAFILWLFSLALGIIPSSLSGRDFKFYDNSHVCIGLPLALVERFKTEELFERIEYDVGFEWYGVIYNDKFSFNTTSIGSAPGLFFSSAVFLGLNCLCYFVICGCYVEIIRSVLKSSKQAKLNKEMKDQVRMTVKVAAIVATDFCCWFPVILLGSHPGHARDFA